MTQDVPNCISDLFGKVESHDYTRPVTDDSGRWHIVAEKRVEFHVQPGDTVRLKGELDAINGQPMPSGTTIVLQRKVFDHMHIRRLIAIVDRGVLKLKLGLE